MSPRSEFGKDLEGCQDARQLPLVVLLVQLAHDEAEASPALTVPDVCRRLATSKSTISAATKEAYGIGPKQLLIRVRLEYCHHAFTTPVGTTKVEITMRRYGFTNRKKFADYYRAVYQELPSATLQRGYGQLRIKGI